MNLVPFAEYIEGLGLGEQGKTLFINHMPQDATNAVLLRERLIGAQLDHDLPGYIKFQFQVIVRSSNYLAGQTLATDIAKYLRLHGGQELGEYHVKYVRPQNVPVPYPISSGELVEWNTDFDACVVDESWA